MFSFSGGRVIFTALALFGRVIVVVMMEVAIVVAVVVAAVAVGFVVDVIVIGRVRDGFIEWQA